MGEPGCALEENILCCRGWIFSDRMEVITPYMPHPAYNNPERINNEGGGITGYMYLKYNDLELEKVDASWTNFACIVMRKHC
mgnify:CR=1 FL=1